MELYCWDAKKTFLDLDSVIWLSMWMERNYFPRPGRLYHYLWWEPGLSNQWLQSEIVSKRACWIFILFSPFPALLFCTSLFYILSIIFAVLFYIFYTKPDGCTENKVFISLNLIFCVAVSVVSILPKIQVWWFSVFFCERLRINAS